LIAKTRPVPRLFAVGLVALACAGCRQDMQDQPKFVPQRSTTFFADGRSVRPQVAHTVARGQLGEDSFFYTGLIDGKEADLMPFPVSMQVLARGQERFNIYCTPCHGRLGDGNGMVVLRGFRQPPSYYSERLMHAPVGHFFDVISNGFGAMPSYATRVETDDRWRVVAYIRALQLSESATPADVPPGQVQTLTVEPPPRVAGTSTGPDPGAQLSPAGVNPQ
jgi:mono/diheme cytochrome c family protein